MAGSPLHFVTLAISAFLICATLLLDFRFGLRRVIGCFSLGVWVLMQAAWVSPALLDFTRSLPLHVCDLAGLIGALALIWQWRWARAVLFFWAIGLTTQGFITPVVDEAPGDIRFWMFWMNHVLVLGMAIEDFVVGRYRPTRRDSIGVILGTGVYVLLMFALDCVTGWNYGFVGPTPEDASPTAVDLFGPWPWRVIWMSVIVAAWFTLLGWLGSRVPAGRIRQPG